MTTKTERRNMERIQDALGVIKAAAREEIEGNKESGNARHLNAWCGVLHKAGVYHHEITNMGFEMFPEFFGEVVTKGGGGGR